MRVGQTQLQLTMSTKSRMQTTNGRNPGFMAERVDDQKKTMNGQRGL